MVYDFIVIGGGPAGSTISTFLSQKGYSVKLFEKEKFPRSHVGESLLPHCYSIFKKLGVLNEMSKRFVKKPGVQFTDAQGENRTTYCFKNVIEGPESLSYHVRRSEFDKMLLDNSSSKGVHVCEEYRVKNVDLSQNDLVLVSTIDKMKKKEDHQGKFLIDASGRDTFISSKQKTRKPIEGLERTAFHAHWEVEKMPKDLIEGVLRIAYLGGEKQGWIWCIPNDTNRISVGVVLNSNYVNNFRKEYTQSNDWQEELYMQELKKTDTIWELVKDGKRATQIWLNGDYSYYSTNKFGENFAMVGDSGQFIDPIFASGVFIALKSAEMVSDALDKKFKNGDKDALKTVYNQHIANAYDTVARFIKIYYDPNAIGLHEFNTDNNSISETQDHKTAFSLFHHLLSGEFFERAGEYKMFLDSLEKPRVFTKWKHLTKFSPENKGHSCGMKQKEIFPKT